MLAKTIYMFVSILLEIERKLQKSLLFGILPILSFRVSFYRAVMIRPTVRYSESFESIMHTLQPAIWTTDAIGNSDHIYVTRNDKFLSYT